jgi:hypothetical protein
MLPAMISGMELDHATFRGPRAELVDELRKAAVGWRHFDKPELSEQAHLGATRLEQGESTVRVGHAMYTVTD